MENRFQHIFLIRALFASLCLLAVIAPRAHAQALTSSKIDSEFLEIGFNAGIVTIEDFPTEFAWGLNATFRATEDFFLQVNYMQAADVALSSREKAQGAYYTGSNRDFTQYDFLLGANIFQGEFFSGQPQARLSSLYVVAGVGEVSFGEGKHFAITAGLGYRIAFNRRYVFTLDVRDYIYQASLTSGDDERTVNNIYLSTGLSYLF
jgi:outer membrane beta-barrel protein